MTDFASYNALLTATAAGDSLGLPYEGISGPRVRKLVGERLVQKFLPLGFGMISDDTEHALITGRALVSSGGDPNEFGRSLSRRLRRWVLTMPPGVGKATLVSCLSMWFRPHQKTGRASAGNGPLMRAPIIGLFHRDDAELRNACIYVSTTMTHTDPRAIMASSAIAGIVAAAARTQLGTLVWADVSLCFRSAVGRCAGNKGIDHATEFLALVDQLDKAHDQGKSIPAALADIGCGRGVDGYVLRSSLAAAYIASHASGADEAIDLAVRQGGDTDSTAAIAGAISSVLKRPLEDRTLTKIKDWPVDGPAVDRHAHALADRRIRTMDEPPYFRQIIRNAAFLVVAMVHVARRLAPPYR